MLARQLLLALAGRDQHIGMAPGVLFEPDIQPVLQRAGAHLEGEAVGVVDDLGARPGGPNPGANPSFAPRTTEQARSRLFEHFELGVILGNAELIQCQFLGFIHRLRGGLDPLHRGDPFLLSWRQPALRSPTDPLPAGGRGNRQDWGLFGLVGLVGFTGLVGLAGATGRAEAPLVGLFGFTGLPPVPRWGAVGRPDLLDVGFDGWRVVPPVAFGRPSVFAALSFFESSRAAAPAARTP